MPRPVRVPGQIAPPHEADRARGSADSESAARAVNWPLLSLLAVIALMIADCAWLLHSADQLRHLRIDDSYITFAYSRNLAHGLGPVYAQHLPRAEGCTSVLWMWLNTIPFAYDGDPLAFSRVVSIVSLLAASVLIGQAVWIATHSKMASAISALAIMIWPVSALHAMTGMETCFSAMLVSAALAAYFACLRSQRSLAFILFFAVCFAMILTRPESAVLAVCLSAGIAVNIEPASRKSFLMSSLALAVPLACYWAWRWGYYGLALPLPFYIKSAQDGTLPGWEHVTAFAKLLPVQFTIICAAVAVIANTKKALPIVVTGILTTAYFCTVRPIMDYEFRYAYPYVPLLIVLAGIGINTAMSLIKRLPIRNAATAAAGVALLYAFASYHTSAAAMIAQSDSAQSVLMPLSLSLKSIRGAGEPFVLCMGDAGIVPFESGWDNVDYEGLNCRSAAFSRSLVARKFLVRQFHPDVIVVRSIHADRFTGWEIADEAIGSYALTHGYASVEDIPYDRVYSWWIFANPTSRAGSAFLAEHRKRVRA